jgi:hypothetical protein
LGRPFDTHSYKPHLLGGMLVAVGGRAKEQMEGKDLAVAMGSKQADLLFIIKNVFFVRFLIDC